MALFSIGRNMNNLSDSVGLNHVRPDVGRPGFHTFVHDSEWIVDQFVELGCKWNRLAFSWPLVQPEANVFDWELYDRIVDDCAAKGIQIVATLGGHFDDPAVPAWAGTTLKDVVNHHPEHQDRFVEAWVKRYKDRITYWEILNEPKVHHKGLTVVEYCEKVLRPANAIVKSLDSKAKTLACAYNNLPVVGERIEFWDAARGHYDILNHHQYDSWGMFRTEVLPNADVAETQAFRDLADANGEADKPIWITEMGWWGTGSLADTVFDTYKQFPGLWTPVLEAYTGRELIEHPILLREDEHRARWMEAVCPELLKIRGCEKIFLWVSMDEFEGGFEPNQLYGRLIPGKDVRPVDLWGIIGGDKKWKETAHALQRMLAK